MTKTNFKHLRRLIIELWLFKDLVLSGVTIEDTGLTTIKGSKYRLYILIPLSFILISSKWSEICSNQQR